MSPLTGSTGPIPDRTLAQPFINHLPQPIVVGPGQEFHLGDELCMREVIPTPIPGLDLRREYGHHQSSLGCELPLPRDLKQRRVGEIVARAPQSADPLNADATARLGGDRAGPPARGALVIDPERSPDLGRRADAAPTSDGRTALGTPSLNASLKRPSVVHSLTAT